jgi:hypothetical protein
MQTKLKFLLLFLDRNYLKIDLRLLQANNFIAF